MRRKLKSIAESMYLASVGLVHSAHFELHDHVMAIAADCEQPIEFIRQYFYPYLKESYLPRELSMQLYVITNPCIFRLLVACQHLRNTPPTPSGWRSAQADERTTLYYRDGEVYILLGPQSKIAYIAIDGASRRSLLIPMREARALAEKRLIVNDYVTLHASCVENAGKVICISGPKFSGKTTTLINLLIGCQYSFVSNDKIFIDLNNENIKVKALPIAAGIRSGTLQAFPKLGNALSNPAHLHPDNHSLVDGDSRARNSRVYVSPSSLARLCDTEVAEGGMLSCVIFPRYEHGRKNAVLRMLTTEEARNQIKPQIMESKAEDYGIIAEKTYGGNYARYPASISASLIAKAVPCFELLQSDATNHETASLIKEFQSCSRCN